MVGTPANLWYKSSILYALHIRSFYDSDGDGIGDINGLIERLDYIEDLGADCLSLMPFYPSPLRDDGYDISDYCDIHSDYGNLEQFRRLLEEAHLRGIRVVIDLILNHTSTAHEWFQRARRARAGSPERDFYVWSENPEHFSGAEVLFSDFESSNWEWDNVARAYYWHRFYNHQPDLNYDNPLVREEIRKVIDFWFDLGVDGLRLTSIAFLFQREGTTSENLPEVHEFLRELRRHIDKRHPGKILLAETNLWPEEAAEYLGQGDQCHLNYHYPLMPRMYMALQTEDRYPIIDILDQTPPIPETTQWALFLRNHDDLTLSMVTEEERDFLYKALAQDHSARINEGIRRRLAPLLGNDRRKLELMYLLLFSLPGTPVLFYGDEIGMGDNIYLGDRKGIRTPMQWNGGRNAGFSRANPQKLFLPVITDPLYRFEAVNVEVQSRNPASLLWWIKNLIAVRKRHKAFSHGSIEFLNARNSKVLAFERTYEGERILVVINLSKFSQAVTLDLPEFEGVEPVEIFSRSRFSAIGEGPYPITLGPYGYYWFQLEKSEAPQDGLSQERTILELEMQGEWPGLFEQYNSRRQLEKRILPGYMQANRWYGGKSRNAVAFEVNRFPAIHLEEEPAFLALIEVRYTEGLPDTYFLPITLVTNAERIVHYLKNEPRSVICYLKAGNKEGILIDAIYDAAFRNELFRLIRKGGNLELPGGALRFEAGKILSEVTDIPDEAIQSEVLRAEQSNTSVIYNDRFFFKIYRKLDTDINPDLELVRFLSERTGFRNAPRYGGGIQYEERAGQSFTILGLLQNKIPNQGEAWTAMLDTLGSFYEQALAIADRSAPLPELVVSERMYFEQAPEQLQQLIGRDTYDKVALLAVRTAEMHIALASEPEDPAFAPVRFTPHYQRSVYSAHRKLVSEKLDALELKLPTFPAHIAAEARTVLNLREDILKCFRRIYSTPIDSVKTRIHGDYHLGQVLYDGQDFYIIDFEGEPMLSISERRLKRTPFKDVAGMIRSFHYAAYGKLLLNANLRKDDMAWSEQWARQWYHYVSRFFLTAYLDRAAGQPFIPANSEAAQLLLRIYLLEKAIYEVGYEMNARPEWLRIPLKGVLFEMEAEVL
jgi:maltose alpha-D-glucosyltransferase / alpha-amylase